MSNHEYNSRELYERLKAYENLLLKWNSKINLISKHDESKVWERHFLDSMQLLNYISDKDVHLVDIGSGAGFPGMILSIAGVKKVTLIESDKKKATFLLQVSTLSDNKVNVINDRVENIQLDIDIITARAFSSLENIFLLTRKIKVKDKFLLLKGNAYKEELIKAQQNWKFDYKLHDSITANRSKIFEITNLKSL